MHGATIKFVGTSLVLSSGRFNLGGKALCTNLMGVWMGPRDGMDVSEKKNVSCH